MTKSSDSDILDYESEHIANEPDILINKDTLVTEIFDNEQEFQVLPSFATKDAQYELVHHPQPNVYTPVSNSNPMPRPIAEVMR